MIIEDNEFGSINVRRTAASRSLRARVAPDGKLRLSVPKLTPLFVIKRLIAAQRPEFRKLVSSSSNLVLTDGMSLGKSHSLHVRSGPVFSAKTNGQQLIVTLSPGQLLDQSSVVQQLKPYIIKLLRKEAKHYLPRRLAQLADQNNYSFSAVRFSHASSRWGSCNHEKSISLNIALMNLPFELIDYVLLHELAHTKELNHSDRFWELVAASDQNYRQHRVTLKSHSPNV